MTDPYPHSPTRRRFRRGAAATAAAALAGTVLAPGLATGPAAAAPDCDDALPYRAAATADLLRLSALDLPIAGLGPLVDARIAATGAGMAGDDLPASAAAARDLELNLLGAELATPLSVEQVAPPANGESAKDSRGHLLINGLLELDTGTVDAHATWNDELACGTPNGTVATGSASLVNAALLPNLRRDGALVALPDNLSSWSATGLVDHNGLTAAQATAAASLVDLRVFAGSRGEITVKVISEPTLQVTATGEAETSEVSYDSPVLEVHIPGVGSITLDGNLSTIDIPLLRSAPPAEFMPSLIGYTLDDVLEAVDQQSLGGLTTDGQQTTAALPGLDTPEPRSSGSLPLLGEVVPDLGSLNLKELSVLRLSLGELEQAITDDEVSASAASVRLQVLRWGGKSGPADQANAVLDLGIGLLSANAEAPAPVQDDSDDPEPPGAGGDCEECPDDELPVTGSTIGMIAGAGVLLALAGRLMMLVNRGNRGKRLLIG